MAAEFLIVDTSSLQRLYEIGGAEALDTLLSGDNRIVITKNCYDEILKYDGHENVLDWISRNKNKIHEPEYYDKISLSDPTKLPEAGDRSIKSIVSGKIVEKNGKITNLVDAEAVKAVESFAPEGAKFTLLSDDLRFIGNLESESHGFSKLKEFGFVSEPHFGAMHYLAARLMDGTIEKKTYLKWLDKYRTSDAYLKLKETYQGKIDEKILTAMEGTIFTRSDVEAFNIETLKHVGIDSTKLFVKSSIIAGTVIAARKAGIIGDVMSFAITAAYAADQLEQGNKAAANETWVKYLFETAGGISGAAIGLLAGARLGPWGGVAASIVGSVAGSWGGAKLGSEIYKISPQTFDPVFDEIYQLMGRSDSVVSYADNYIFSLIDGLGFNLITTQGGAGSDLIVASNWGERRGNGGDDLLIAWRAGYIAAGGLVDENNPTSDRAKANLFLTLDGGSGRDKLISIGGSGAVLKGGRDSDWLVGWGGEDHLWGGDGSGRDDKASDIFTVSGDTFVHDAQTSDFVTWGPLRLTGGVQQSWMEAGWAYWTPFSSVLSAALPLTFLGPLGAAGVLTDLVTANIFRYGLTQSGQLVVEFGRGRLGHAVIENYKLDLTTGAASGHIVAFRQEIGRSSLADFVAYVNLALKASFGTGIDGTDPLVLDLDGDGIELQGRQAADIYFNFGLQGFGVRTAWVRKDDAFLTRDLNGNGKIDDVGELFGNATTSGFAHLRTLDSNKDGRITITDAAFGTLRLWQDRNGNGVTDTGELRTLGEAGITAISLNTRAPPVGQIAGSTVEAVATFTRANGTSSTIADVRLDSNATDSRYLGDRTVSAAADALPDLKGYGRVMDLGVAMTKDAALLARVAKLNDLKADTNWAAREKAVADVLFRWAGVDDVAPVRMGEGAFDTRKLAFLETYFGYELTPRDEAGTPAETNLNELIASWNDVLAKETLRLAVQGPLKSLFKGINYDAAADRFSSASPYTLAEVTGADPRAVRLLRRF